MYVLRAWPIPKALAATTQNKNRFCSLQERLLDDDNVRHILEYASGKCGFSAACVAHRLFFLCTVVKMKKSVGCFTEEKLKELAEQPNVTVMTPTHDVQFEPWTALRVQDMVDRIVAMTRAGTNATDMRRDAEVDEFARHYQVFFSKLTDPAFAADPGHIGTVKQLVTLRAAVEQKMIDPTAAQAQCADVALKSLASRVRPRAS